MVIKAGDYEVLSTGSVITFQEEPITFILADDFIVNIIFQDSGIEGAVAKVEFSSVVNGQIDMILLDFEGALPAGSNSPLYMGDNNGRNVYLNYRVQNLPPSKSRTLFYTWYERELITEPRFKG